MLKLKVSFHINISLNYKLINERDIKKEYLDLEDKYKEQAMVNKYINLSKYLDDTNKLENEIFNVLISRITKKLDNGKYEKRLKKSSSESTNNTFSSDDFTTDKLVSKKV